MKWNEKCYQIFVSLLIEISSSSRENIKLLNSLTLSVTFPDLVINEKKPGTERVNLKLKY